MSAPQTNIHEQERRHKGPLSGMALAFLFGVLMIGILGIWLVANGNEPRDASGEEAPAGVVQQQEADETRAPEVAPAEPGVVPEATPGATEGAETQTVPAGD
ncbi:MULTISPECIES: hypothetical protein [Roseovarius]|uniref:hypothetical protein n=1 Tax=Roseovarius TaxID=74030 RepID=UPI001C09CD58|nr:hypothetical protein [Roseovarius nubinhibens]MBU3001100.1 hypothetical protein [Roseovarius nubinhibens]